MTRNHNGNCWKLCVSCNIHSILIAMEPNRLNVSCQRNGKIYKSSSKLIYHASAGYNFFFVLLLPCSWAPEPTHGDYMSMINIWPESKSVKYAGRYCPYLCCVSGRGISFTWEINLSLPHPASRKFRMEFYSSSFRFSCVVLFSFFYRPVLCFATHPPVTLCTYFLLVARIFHVCINIKKYKNKNMNTYFVRSCIVEQYVAITAHTVARWIRRLWFACVLAHSSCNGPANWKWYPFLLLYCCMRSR